MKSLNDFQIRLNSMKYGKKNHIISCDLVDIHVLYNFLVDVIIRQGLVHNTCVDIQVVKGKQVLFFYSQYPHVDNKALLENLIANGIATMRDSIKQELDAITWEHIYIFQQRRPNAVHLMFIAKNPAGCLALQTLAQYLPLNSMPGNPSNERYLMVNHKYKHMRVAEIISHYLEYNVGNKPELAVPPANLGYHGGFGLFRMPNNYMQRASLGVALEDAEQLSARLNF